MKKIKLANTFLTVNKVLSIISLVVFAIGMVLMPTLVGLLVFLAKKTGDITQEIQSIIDVGLGVVITAIVLVYAFMLSIAIVSLCFTNYAKKHLKTATCHCDIVKPSVFAIISGALTGIFGIPAGIILLTTKDSDFKTVEEVK